VVPLVRRPVRLIAPALVMAAVLAGVACGADGGLPVEEADDGVPSTVTVPPPPPTTAPPTTTATTSTTTPPTTTIPPPPVYREGDQGPGIAQLQQALLLLGFRPGEPDGRYGAATTSAVLAFQKHEGLQRDGVAGPEVLGALARPPTGAGPRDPGPGPRLEVDLDRQIMFVTLADGSRTVLNVSTGSGETYRHPRGSAVAATPVGTYAIGRKVDALERAPLGVLYRPMYFTGGFAVHGSPSVPAYPASHGCIRVSNVDEDWLFPRIPPGTPITIYSGAPVADPGTDSPIA